MVFVNANSLSVFATDELFLFFLSPGRCGNSESGKFSLPVSLLAHTFEMFILERYVPAISAGGIAMII